MKTKIVMIIMMTLGLIIPFNVYSQSTESIQRITVKSPEVAAFERVVEIPVNTYTGVPDISIPIYTVKSGDLSLPISLDYHASAIKVDQEATWVGLNWNLNAGGVIATQVAPPSASNLTNDWKHLFNDLVLNPVSNFHQFFGYSVGDYQLGLQYKISGNHEMSQIGFHGLNRFKCLVNYTPNDLSFDLYDRILRNGEGEAQLYFANFLGKSFKFAYNILQDNFTVVGKDQKVKIEGSPFLVTKLTDADGIQYYFGEVETNIADHTDGAYNKRAVSCYLSQIVSPSGRTIKLKYKKYGTISPLPSVVENAYYDHPNRANHKVDRNLLPSMSINNSYLYEIESDDAIIRFDVGSRTDMRGSAKKLEYISVIDRPTNKLVKKFKLNYGYFVGNRVGGNSIYDYYNQSGNLLNYNSIYADSYIYNRLKLLSITEQGVNAAGAVTNSLPPYTFFYNSPELPCKTSAARDYWGFYNGKENIGGTYGHTLIVNQSRVGEDTYNGFPYTNTITYADNRPNPESVQAGLLTGIQYPTGGYTEFYYEPHQFTNYRYFDCNTTSAPPTISVSTMDTNTNSTIPAELTGTKDFTVTVETEVDITIRWTNRAAYYWKEMWPSPAMLMKYATAVTPNGPVEYVSGFKTWTINPIDTLDKKEVVYRYTLTLSPGKYQLKPMLSSPQIVPYVNFPGDKRVEMSLRSTLTKTSTGGGIRIKEIRQRENTNVASMLYSYITETGSSSGLLMSPIKFGREKMLLYQNTLPGNTEIPDMIHEQSIRPPVEKKYWVQSSENMVPGTETKIGYGRVVVNKNGGKTAYYYWNRKLNTNPLFDYYKPLEDPHNGNMIKQCIYDSSDNLKQEIETTYSVLNKELHYINIVAEDIYYGYENCSEVPSAAYNPYALIMTTGRMMLYVYPSAKFWIEKTKQTVKEYVNGKSIITDYAYTYNPSNLSLASVEQSIYGSEDKESSYFVYPQDYDLSNGTFLKSMADKHILNSPVEKVTVVKKANTQYVSSGILKKYNANGQIISLEKLGIQDSLLLSNFKFSNKSVNGVLGTTQGSVRTFDPNSNYSPEAICKYSDNGNLIQLTENDNSNIVYLWGYNKQYVIAEIVNSTYDSVRQALGCTTDAQMALLENQNTPDITEIRQKLDKYFKNSIAQITTYVYKPLVGVIKKTDPRGVMTTYEYDSFGRLDAIKDHEGKTVQQFVYNYNSNL